MTIPSREDVVEWGMALYHHVFILVFVLSVVTIAYIVHNLVPRKEY